MSDDMRLTEAEREAIDNAMPAVADGTEGWEWRVLYRAVARIKAEAVIEFAQWVATNRAYNGSAHPLGQSLYNECLNAVLPTWAAEYAALDGADQ